MNDPIISPWLFYLLSLVDSFLITAAVLLTLAVTAGIISALSWYDCYNAEVNKPIYAKQFKLSCCISILLAVSLILIPSSGTITKMVATQYITPKSISSATGLAAGAKEIIKQDILDIIEAATGGQEKTE